MCTCPMEVGGSSTPDDMRDCDACTMRRAPLESTLSSCPLPRGNAQRLHTLATPRSVPKSVPEFVVPAGNITTDRRKMFQISYCTVLLAVFQEGRLIRPLVAPLNGVV